MVYAIATCDSCFPSVPTWNSRVLSRVDRHDPVKRYLALDEHKGNADEPSSVGLPARPTISVSIYVRPRGDGDGRIDITIVRAWSHQTLFAQRAAHFLFSFLPPHLPRTSHVGLSSRRRRHFARRTESLLRSFRRFSSRLKLAASRARRYVTISCLFMCPMQRQARRHFVNVPRGHSRARRRIDIA